MTNNRADTKAEPKGNREIQREQTRARIMQAVLDIIVEQGMRAVRHRAVAKRAGVSLGSITYHFTSIEDLITSTFDYWREQKMMAVNPYYHKVKERLQSFEGTVVPPHLRAEMATWICEQSIGYICDQIDGKHYDRIVELAFYHESIRFPTLRTPLRQIRQDELEYLTQVHRIMGSPQPADDARITVALFRQLEQSVVMAVLPGLDTNTIRQTIQRHTTLCFNVPFPPTA